MVSVRTALKKSFEQMYVPQERQPFIYMSLELDPRNVQPAKHEVHFLHEDSVIDKVRSAVESKLLGCNAARKFYAQSQQRVQICSCVVTGCRLLFEMKIMRKQQPMYIAFFQWINIF
ncbi:DNA mismatch repair protein Mlh1-like isoform X1 [Periplaneta americana]|uniref:DNA mismatch repair protein Mlh1-like isoform X1 n=1 Tax=Periplaneta americana TaxID=6978 RepID=UPI0037E82FFE